MIKNGMRPVHPGKMLREDFSQVVIGERFPFLGQPSDVVESHTSFDEHL